MNILTLIKNMFSRKPDKIWDESSLIAWVSFYDHKYKLYGYYVHGTKNLPKNGDLFSVDNEGEITEYIIYNLVLLDGILVANLICIKGNPPTKGNYLRNYWSVYDY